MGDFSGGVRGRGFDVAPLIMEDKSKIREELKRAVKEFLERGGQIQYFDCNVFTFDSVMNRSKKWNDRENRLLRSQRRGAKNGNAART